jgi:RNA-binding protein 39
VSQIHPKVDERDLFEFFSLAGRVEDIRLIKDQRTHKSKGLCYVEFWDKESVMKACALTGQLLCGYPITVVQVQLDKNKTAASGDSMRLYVGSLHFNVTEGDLKPVFEAFGAVEFIEIHKDPGTGQSKGFGFVQFKNSADAKAALVSLNGLEIAGRPIKVGLGEQSGGAKTDKTSEADLRELDDDGGAGVAMNAGSRQALMAKLSQRGQAPKSSNVIAQAENLPVPRIQPTTCVVVKNMFDPKLESEANWDSDIREDVTEECEKLGAKVKHIYVDTMSQGNVYLRFFTVPAAESVVKAFHGRFFATKQIQAEHITETTYLLKFPDAR